MFEPKNTVFTPAETITYAKQRIHEIANNQERCLNFPIKGIDEYFAPLLPGEICTIIAQTSNYKSGFADFWEYQAAKQLQDQNRDEVIVHISVEEAVEEQAYRLLSRELKEDAGDLARGQFQNWDKLDNASIKVGNIPIYRIGHCLARPEYFPDLYLSNLVRAIKFLQDKLLDRKIVIAAIFVDYLQALPYDPETIKSKTENRRRLQVREDIYRTRYMAQLFNCPVVLLVQAKQNLAGSGDKRHYVPGIYDGEESSAIAQRTDRSVQLWMPKMNWPIGTILEYGNIMPYTVYDNSIWIKVGKQRGRLPSGKSWLCEVDFVSNIIKVKNNADIYS